MTGVISAVVQKYSPAMIGVADVVTISCGCDAAGIEKIQTVKLAADNK